MQIKACLVKITNFGNETQSQIKLCMILHKLLLL